MALTSKDRAALRGMANKLETIGQVGKDGVTDAVAAQVLEALEARQLVKFRVLKTSSATPRECAETLARMCDADVVHTIGTRFMLYKADKKSPLLPR